MLTFSAFRRITDPDFLKSPSVWTCSSKDVQASTRKLKDRTLFRWQDAQILCNQTHPHYSIKVTNGLCLAKSRVKSLSLSCSILDHSWWSWKYSFSLHLLPAVCLTAPSQTSFPLLFLPDFSILRSPRAPKPSFLYLFSFHRWSCTTHIASKT